MRPGPLAEILDATADTCRLTTDVDGWSPEQADLVLARLHEAMREETTLAQRLRVVATGGFEHDEIPDLMGHCVHCGAPTAAVPRHKSGYCWDFADPFLMPVMRRIVRIRRWTRSTVAYLRGRTS